MFCSLSLPRSLSHPGPNNPFIIKYAVYHHFRSLGWVVRGGLKFSVDYLLYKRGPVFSHAEFAFYFAWIRVLFSQKTQILYNYYANWRAFQTTSRCAHIKFHLVLVEYTESGKFSSAKGRPFTFNTVKLLTLKSPLRVWYLSLWISQAKKFGMTLQLAPPRCFNFTQFEKCL